LGVDRTAIARVVEHVLEAQGIPRGSRVSAPAQRPAHAAKPLPSPAEVAAEIAGRFFGPTVSAKAAAVASAPAPSPNPPRIASTQAGSTKPAVQISVFVSENDVRRAMTRSEKIFIGPKTILTPSARDLGLEHAVFVETEAGSIR